MAASANPPKYLLQPKPETVNARSSVVLRFHPRREKRP